MNRGIFILSLILGVLLIGACSGRDKTNLTGPLAVSEEEMGPVTEDLVKQLPRGLIGDTANAQYSSQTFRGEDEDDGAPKL